MGTAKMKGIFKGIRYISNIFEIREEEMVIGFPTDVKHIAHIGCDGHSTTAPNWMKEFEQTYSSGEPKPTSPKESSINEKTKTVSRRRQSGTKSSPIESSEEPGSSSTKHSRRHRSSGGVADSPVGDGIALPSVPKRPSRRKSKGQNTTTGGEALRSSRRSKRSSSTESLPDTATTDPKIHHIHSNSLPQPRKWDKERDKERVKERDKERVKEKDKERVKERVKGSSRSARTSKEPSNSDPTGPISVPGPDMGECENPGRRSNEEGGEGESKTRKDWKMEGGRWVQPKDLKTSRGDYCSVVESNMALTILY